MNKSVRGGSRAADLGADLGLHLGCCSSPRSASVSLFGFRVFKVWICSHRCVALYSLTIKMSRVSLYGVKLLNSQMP